jgi:hypothetical protein
MKIDNKDQERILKGLRSMSDEESKELSREISKSMGLLDRDKKCNCVFCRGY